MPPATATLLLNPEDQFAKAFLSIPGNLRQQYHLPVKLTKEMLRDYLKRLLVTGNGEYDSQIYYPHSIEGFLNLYDFSPDEETRELAKFALDYYFVTYGLKVIDGTIAGAQKRGYLAGSSSSFNNASRNMEGEGVTIQQATTKYRPNQVIWNIVNKRLKFPFEAKLSRPFYHMDHGPFVCRNLLLF